ncbi:DUF6724 family protein, partial [uncultured Senegalimassilia sp.]|uniref:DUF6724 family protein n=1 Tax=uncultured Senegalimassilia sp. TaxID=1714350 RepID=UPI0025E7C89E
ESLTEKVISSVGALIFTKGSVESLYHFFFESFAGVGILVLAGLVISVLVCVIMEWRTRQAFKDRGEVEDDDDDFTFFDDDDDEDE